MELIQPKPLATLAMDNHQAMLFVRAKCGSALLLSRLTLYMTTLLWAMLVLLQDNATRVMRYGQLVTPANEDGWGIVLGTVAVTRLVMIANKLRRGVPVWGMSPLAAVLHSVLMTFWLYVFLAQFVGPAVWPAVTSATGAVSLLAVYGLVGDMAASWWKSRAPCAHVTPAGH